MNEPLPKGWAWSTIGEVCTPISKVDPRKELKSDFTYIDIGGVEMGGRGISETKRLQGAEAPSRARQQVQAGDTVLSTVRTYQKKTAMVGRELDGAIASTGFAVLRPSCGLHPSFLLYQVMWDGFVSRLNDLQTGTSYPAVRNKDVRAQPIRVAPRAEQERIVTVIEEHLSRLDAAEASVMRAGGNASILPALACQELFEGDWPTARIGDVARVGSGATPKRSDERFWSDGTIPWVTSGALNRRAIKAASEFITEAALTETGVKLWPVGTVLVAMYGEGKTRGKAARLEIASACNQACAAIDFDRTVVDGDYILAFLNSQYEANRKLASGGVQPNLNLGLIKDMVVPLPDIAEQRRIAERAKEIAEGAERLAISCEAARARAGALRRSVLSAAFFGQLVPQDPSDEPASVLLERMIAEQPVKKSRKKKSG